MPQTLANGTITYTTSNGCNKLKGNNVEEELTAFTYQDPDHFSFLLNKLNTLRKNKQFCDVILQIGNQQDIHEIYAHRSVLASASPYFFELFTSDSNIKGSTNLLQYKLLNGHYDVDSFEHLINYIYTSRLEIPVKSVKSVYAVANRLKMCHVAHKCGQFLASNLTEENCLAVRSIPGVLADPILLNAVDNYIRQNITGVAQSRYMEKIPKVQIEVLQNSNKDRSSVNGKNVINMVLEWIRKSFDRENLSMDYITEKVHMLYLNKSDKSFHDCNDIENGDYNFSEVIQDYKTMSKRLSIPAKVLSENVKNEINGHQQTPAKVRPYFTRSDSESSLSSLNDDDESDWKIVATHSAGETCYGLLMLSGKLFLVTIKYRLNTPTNTPNPKDEPTEIKTDAYYPIQALSSGRCTVGTAEFEGKLLICGGYDRGECLRTTELYDENTNKWTTLAPMNVPRGRFDVAVLNGNIYAVGGSDGQQELDSAEYFDSKKRFWIQIPNCPVARSNAGVSSLDGKIYAIGGWNGQRGLQRCDVYDPETETWAQIAPLPTGRYQAGCASFNGEIYAVGGCDSWTCLNTVEKYNPISNTWKPVTSLGIARRGCGVHSFNGKLYVIGGHDGMHSLSSVEVFDPETNSWSSGPPLTCSRANVGVAVVGDRLYAVGGFSGKTFLNTIEFLDTLNNEWTSFVTTENNLSENVSEEDLTDEAGIRHSLSKSSVMSDEPLVEVECEEVAVGH